MIKLIFEIAGRCSIWIILMFLIWNTTLSFPEQTGVLGFVLLSIFSLLAFVWAHLLPYCEYFTIEVQKVKKEVEK